MKEVQPVVSNEKEARDIKIHLVNSITTAEGENERYEMWLFGQKAVRAGMPYIKYEEVQDDQSIHTTIKCSTDQALIMRSGAIKMRLPLSEGQISDGHYEHMLGKMPLQTVTHQLSFEETEQGGKFSCTYEIIMNGASVGQYNLNISFQEV